MLIVMIVTYHYRYFWVPVNKRYIFEKSFLNDNEYLGPISVDALNSAINKKLFCYRYKWEKEVELPVGYNTATARWFESDGETTGIVIWQDIVPGLTYSVSMKQNATLENLFILANAVYIPVQGDS